LNTFYTCHCRLQFVFQWILLKKIAIKKKEFTSALNLLINDSETFKRFFYVLVSYLYKKPRASFIIIWVESPINKSRLVSCVVVKSEGGRKREMKKQNTLTQRKKSWQVSFWPFYWDLTPISSQQHSNEDD
jgi:hypothetical protein